MIHHDIRASLFYSCLACLHEWQIDATAEPPQTERFAADLPLTPLARTARPRPRKR